MNKNMFSFASNPLYNLDFTGANPQLQLLYEIAEKAYTGFGLKYLEAKEL